MQGASTGWIGLDPHIAQRADRPAPVAVTVQRVEAAPDLVGTQGLREDHVVTALGGALECPGRHATHPDRRRLIQRCIAVLARPHRGHYLERFVHPFSALIPSQAQGVELDVAVPQTDAKVEPAIREALEGGDGASQRERIVLGGQEDGRAQPQPARDARGQRERVQRRRDPSVVPDAVLGRPDRPESKLFGEHGVLGKGAVVGNAVARVLSHRAHRPEPEADTAKNRLRVGFLYHPEAEFYRMFGGRSNPERRPGVKRSSGSWPGR